jgi:iron complex outermembrane receptor protein
MCRKSALLRAAVGLGCAFGLSSPGFTQEAATADRESGVQASGETLDEMLSTTTPSVNESSVDEQSLPADNLAPSAESSRRNSQSRLVEEIIVTAQKREENVQDVPITVQAFSEGMLDALGIESTRDLQFVAPSLNYGEFVGYSIIFMRGVGTDAFLTADPSITTYVDGVYLPFSFGQTADFGSIDRVEVLKGPQGTLFGRNAVGGAIAVYTADPSFDEASLNLSASYGRFNDAVLKGEANIPLTDTLAVSISGNYHRNDFHYEGTYGRDPSRIQRPFVPEVGRGYRVKTLWQPTDDLDVMLAHAYNEFNGFSTSVTPVVEPTLLSRLARGLLRPGGDPIPQPDYRADLDVAGLGYYSDLTYGRIAYFPGPVDIKLFGSYQYTGNYQFYDFDGSDTPLAEFNSPTRDGSGVRAATAELQFTSTAGSPLSDLFQWVAGIYYFDSQAGFRDPAILYLNSIDPLTNLLLNNPLFDILDPTPLGFLRDLVNLSPTGEVGFTSGVGTESISGYFQLTTFLTDSFSLTLGGRYQSEYREANESGTWIRQANGNFINLIDRRPQDFTTDSFSPRVAFEMRPMDGLLAYASYQEATKSATYNAVNIYDTIDFVDPEELTAYEVGVKTDLLDGFRFNAAAWLYKQRDIQTQFVSLLKGGAVSFETAGAAESKGIEFDINWLVFPEIVDDLVIIASGAYVDATYSAYPNASGFNQTTGLLQQNLDFTGNRVPQAAKFTGSLQLNKTFRIPSLNSSMELGADYYYNDGFFWTAQNVEASREPSYSTIGARISWFYEPADLRVTAFGTNIADERYSLQTFTTDFGVVRYQALPSVYGVRLEVNFR